MQADLDKKTQECKRVERNLAKVDFLLCWYELAEEWTELLTVSKDK